jgi:nucleoside-diphosphate-sugar epimerase
MPNGVVMRILVTGATGFIGRRLVGGLRQGGFETTALLLPDEDEAGAAGARIVRGDITRAATLRGVMLGHDAVVHLAGAVGYGQTFERCLRLNRDGTANVAGEAVRCGVRRFVHMSSVSVYGRPVGVRVTEDFPLRKIGDPYGDTKADAERIVTRRAASGELDLTVLRPTVIYGPGDDKFLPKLIENLRAGRARVIGSGENAVDAIHVDDVVDFVLDVVKEQRSFGRAYNLNHPGNPSWAEFVAAVAGMIGVPPPRRHLPYAVAWGFAALMELAARFSGKPPRLTRYAVRVVGRPYEYSVDRARNELGFEPKIDLLSGVRDCLASL